MDRLYVVIQKKKAVDLFVKAFDGDVVDTGEIEHPLVGNDPVARSDGVKEVQGRRIIRLVIHDDEIIKCFWNRLLEQLHRQLQQVTVVFGGDHDASLSGRRLAVPDRVQPRRCGGLDRCLWEAKTFQKFQNR